MSCGCNCYLIPTANNVLASPVRAGVPLSQKNRQVFSKDSKHTRKCFETFKKSLSLVLDRNREYFDSKIPLNSRNNIKNTLNF